MARMILEEKAVMTHAQSKFSSPGVLRLGIPENWMSDGPHDVREELLWDQWNIAKIIGMKNRYTKKCVFQLSFRILFPF